MKQEQASANLNGLKFYHIVAVDSGNGIGLNGDLPWRNKSDLAHFKATTMGQIVLMGRTTYNSLPKQKLPGRHIVVLSKSMSDQDLPKDTYVVRSLDAAILKSKELADDWCLNKVYIAGGSQLYNATANIIDGAMVSRIKSIHKCDTFYQPVNLQFMACVMNKSLEQVDGEAGVEVHEYALIDLTNGGAIRNWQFQWGS